MAEDKEVFWCLVKGNRIRLCADHIKHLEKQGEEVEKQDQVQALCDSCSIPVIENISEAKTSMDGK